MLGGPFINGFIDCLADYFLCNLWDLFRCASQDTLDAGVSPRFQFNGIQVPKSTTLELFAQQGELTTVPSMLGSPFINGFIDCLTDYLLCNLWDLFRCASQDTLDAGVSPRFQFNSIQVPKSTTLEFFAQQGESTTIPSMLGGPFINGFIDCLTDYFLCNLWDLFRCASQDTLDAGVSPRFQFNSIQVPTSTTLEFFAQQGGLTVPSMLGNPFINGSSDYLTDYFLRNPWNMFRDAPPDARVSPTS